MKKTTHARPGKARARALEFLEQGPATVGDMVAALGIRDNTLRSAMYRNQKLGLAHWTPGTQYQRAPSGQHQKLWHLGPAPEKPPQITTDQISQRAITEQEIEALATCPVNRFLMGRVA